MEKEKLQKANDAIDYVTNVIKSAIVVIKASKVLINAIYEFNCELKKKAA